MTRFELAGRPDLHFYALRHFGATALGVQGATMKEIQEHLGHTSVSVAMRYQHTTGRAAELAEKISAQYTGELEEKPKKKTKKSKKSAMDVDGETKSVKKKKKFKG